MVFLLLAVAVAWMSSSVPSKLIANLSVRSAVSSDTVSDNTLVSSLLSLSILLHDRVLSVLVVLLLCDLKGRSLDLWYNRTSIQYQKARKVSSGRSRVRIEDWHLVGLYEEGYRMDIRARDVTHSIGQNWYGKV